MEDDRDIYTARVAKVLSSRMGNEFTGYIIQMCIDTRHFYTRSVTQFHNFFSVATPVTVAQPCTFLLYHISRLWQ